MRNFKGLILSFFVFVNSLIVYSQETVSDFDGTVYKTVTIGRQVWMAEDLRVTHFRNGEEISILKNCGQMTPACVIDKKSNKVYYNWYAVINERNIAPEGWHVPSREEWQELIDYLGGEDLAGGKLKEEGTINWKTPNFGGTNESGFTALPTGFVNYPGGCSLDNNGKYASYFTSSGKVVSYACGIIIKHKSTKVSNNCMFSHKDLLSLRLVKD